jgi:hypothetical protein
MTDKNKDKERLVDSVDSDGNPIKVVVRRPTAEDFRDSQIEYNKAFRSALDSGALLRQRLTDYMREQGIWSDEKQKKNDEFVEKIRLKEDTLKAGGIKLSEAKDIALELKRLRSDFQSFLAERNALDSNSVEGQADNARFAHLVRLCILNHETKQPVFQDQKHYDAVADQPWAIEASSELANMIYGLDPNYANNLEENKFLKEFKFVNEDLQLINKEGHLVDIEGRLLNEDGRYIAYRTEEGLKNKDPNEVYFVNRSGEEVVAVVNDDGGEEWVKLELKDRKPFLDDDGQPIEDVSSAPPKEEEDKTKNTKKKRSTKTETNNV